MRPAVLSLLLLPLLLLGCDSASPVAPEGSILTLSASPDRISSSGQSEITVVARKSSGYPVNPGTTIFLSTSRGSLPSTVETDRDGVARATLLANGQSGTAVVRANAGAAEEAMVEVQIGGGGATSVTLQASPASVPSSGGVIDLLALLRDEQGQPLAGVLVNFTSEFGTLASGGDFVRSDASGRAEDTLEIEPGDIPSSETSFDVSVEVSGPEGELITRTRTITVVRSGATSVAPTASPPPPTATPTP
jgi:hypothetical protein